MIILPSWLVISPLEPPRQDWGIRVLDSSVPVPTVVDVAPQCHPLPALS